MRWTDGTVRAALGLAAAGGVPVAGEGQASVVLPPAGAIAEYSGVSTDTRALAAGALFVALRGDRFDAHDFLPAAAEAGAAGAVVERVPDDAPPALAYYVVPDTLEALGRLARWRRRHLAACVCAITGTNGKTTTKELARAALSTRLRVHATTGNLNNLVGAPLTLLQAPEDTEALVVEVGTNAPGEIARLRDIVEPDAAIVTTVAAGHLEGLGSVEGVLEEKVSLLGHLGRDGVALVGDQPTELPARARSLATRVRVAGASERADRDLRATGVELDAEGRARFSWRGRQVRLSYRGRHNVTNALLALGLAEAWAVDLDAAVEAIAAAEPQKLRGEIRRFGDLRVVVDCYNANPASMAAALDLLLSMPRGGGRVAVLGTMRELGAHSAALHEEAARAFAEADVDLVVATGDFVRAFRPLSGALGARLVAADDPLEAFDRFAGRLSGDEVVLLKGSRGVALERLLPRFAERWGQDDAARGAAVGAEEG